MVWILLGNELSLLEVTGTLFGIEGLNFMMTWKVRFCVMHSLASVNLSKFDFMDK